MDKITLGLLVVAVLQLSYIMYKQPKRIPKYNSRRVFVDTSALIDGRIIALAESGFVSDVLMVPRSVIGELQLLADGSDHDKRSRARFGLDVVKRLQDMKTVEVEIYPDERKVPEGVDNRLLVLAKDHGGAICTVDFNLNKVAQLEEIDVLNVNELAQALRMAYLPGEIARLELTQKGQDSGQAVGYLPDGTMVVVDSADKKIGKSVDVEFIRSFQTAAGRMMFAKLIASNETKPSKAKTIASKLSGRKPVAHANKPNQNKKQTGNQKSHKSINTNSTSGASKRGGARKSNSNSNRSKSSRQQHEDNLLKLVDKQK